MNLTPDERGLLNAYSQPVDFVRKEKYIQFRVFENLKTHC
jgi:hypothetical protein